MLGIPFLDVVRVLAAVLILGNVGFTDRPGVEVGVIGENELASVAALLGVPPPALLRGLTSRTHNARGQLVKSVCDANMVCHRFHFIPLPFNPFFISFIISFHSFANSNGSNHDEWLVCAVQHDQGFVGQSSLLPYRCHDREEGQQLEEIRLYPRHLVVRLERVCS